MWIAELAALVLLGGLLRLAGEAAAGSRWVRRVLHTIVLGSAMVAIASGVLGWYRDSLAAAVSGWLGGVAILLAWWRPYRAFLARWIPIDPGSPLDALGLAVIQGVIGVLVGALLRSGELPSLTVRREQLVVQGIAEVLLAFVLVGFPFSRDWRRTLERLDLHWPGRRTLAGAVLFTFALLAVSVASGALARWLQPEVVARIEERMVPLTTEFGAPGWAFVLGVLAGAGEELLFRGAIQPRYGLLLTALLFTVVHVQYELSVVTLGVVGLAVLLGLERRWFGTTACILTHALYDTLAVLLQAAAR